MDNNIIDEIKKALLDAGWNKETIECFLKNDPITPLTKSFTTLEEGDIDKVAAVEYPRITNSSSLIFKVNK